MKKTTVSITFDDEKLSALKMYLAQKNMQVESELEKSLDTLYAKTVPAGVRDLLRCAPAMHLPHRQRDRKAEAFSFLCRGR